MTDDLGLLIDLHERIRRIFPIQLSGLSRHASEYGITYSTLANGVEKPEGYAAFRCTLTEAVDATMRWLENERAAGDVLVWRVLPQIDRTAADAILYMRCHVVWIARVNELLKMGAPQ